MKCKQAEKLIIEGSRTVLDPAIKAELDTHLLDCPRCSNFKDNFQMIYQGINEVKAPEPSTELLEKTIALCHNELIEQGEIYVFEKYHPPKIRLPKFVWVAFGALLILTIAWAVPVLREVAKSQVITRQAVMVLTMIVQNLIMLLFSPVLLRRLKSKFYGINFQF